MGTIYEVVDERTNTARALKLLLPSFTDDREQRARFEREARITGDIDTDHVVRVLDAGHAAGAPFLVMELFAGRIAKLAFFAFNSGGVQMQKGLESKLQMTSSKVIVKTGSTDLRNTGNVTIKGSKVLLG